MRKSLGTLALLPALLGPLAGCGDDTASDPVDQPGTEQTSTALDYDVLAIVSETAAGGTVSPTLTPVPGPDELAAFTEQFDNDAFREEIAAEVRSHEPREGYVVGAAVVALGCDVPPGVTVVAADDGFTVHPDKVADPLPECFAPVTSVAVIEVSQT
jgi:hypothetical protein